MPTIVAVANLKGGCGKSTTTMQMAGGLNAAGYSLEVFDADQQATSYKWDLNDSLPFKVKSVPLAALEMELMKAVRNKTSDIILIDLPPNTISASSTAMTAANAVVVPVQPERGDYEATDAFLALLKDVLPRNPRLKVMIFINAKNNGRVLERAARDFITDLFKDVPNVTVLETEIPRHAIIPKSHNAGTTLFHLKEARGSKALKAYTTLIQEVIECLN